MTKQQIQPFSIVVGDGFADSTGLYNFIVKAVGADGVPEEEETYKITDLPIIDAFNNFEHVMIQLPEPIDLSAGRYIFAVGQDEPQAAVNFGYDDKADPGAWLFSPVGFGGTPTPWTNISDGSFPTLMLRPIFEANMSTSTEAELLAANIPLTVFPVPFKDQLNILLDYAAKQEVNIQIFDMTGKQWSDLTTNHQEIIHQNVSDLPNGLYLLKLKSGLYQRSIKVVKQ